MARWAEGFRSWMALMGSTCMWAVIGWAMGFHVMAAAAANGSLGVDDCLRPLSGTLAKLHAGNTGNYWQI